MTTDMLKQVIRSKPFRPLVVRLSDGQAIPVDEDSRALVNPVNGKTLLICTPQGGVRIVDVAHVTEVTTR